MRKKPCRFSPNFLLRFWTFLCMGSSKTPKTCLSKKSPKISHKKSTHLRGHFLGGFRRPLGVQFTAPVLVPYAISLGIFIEQPGYLYTTQFVNLASCNCRGAAGFEAGCWRTQTKNKKKRKRSLATERLFKTQNNTKDESQAHLKTERNAIFMCNVRFQEMRHFPKPLGGGGPGRAAGGTGRCAGAWTCNPVVFCFGWPKRSIQITSAIRV
jgi:hypothetical protein